MRTKHAINNIVLQFASLLSGIVLYFALTPYLVEKLGNDMYGLNQLLLQTIGYFSIAEMGIGLSLSVLLYKELISENTDNINALLSAAHRTYIVIAIIIAIAGTIFSFYIRPIFSLQIEYSLYAQVAFLLYILSAVLTYLFNVPAILLNTSQKGHKTYFYQLAKPFLTYGGYVLMVYNGYSIIGIAFISLSVTAWSLYGTNVIAKKEFPWLNVWHFKKNYAILKTSKYIFVEKLLIMVLFQTDIILISYFLGIEHVAGYALYTVFFFYIKEIMIIGTNNITNGAGEMYQRNEVEQLFTLWKDAISLVFFIAIQLCIGIYFIFPHFFKLWMNNGLVLPQSILFFFVTNLFYILTMHPTSVITGAQNYYQKRMKGSIAELSINVLLSCVLIPRYGILGAIISTTIGHYSTNAWFIPMLFFQSIQKPFKIYLYIWFRYGTALLLAAVSGYIFYNQFLLTVFDSITNWYTLIASTICLGIFLLIITTGLFYCLDTNFKNSVARIKGIIKISVQKK
jgi:O-antigen/teichoic acid export membrane protein